ncbi:TPR domain protein [Aspergillus lucknowensis]|uniref:SET domain-containing protein n=1 Tax=Aspergillus lucknowensis TaxID=176173 RepID=A0ABR4LNM8_9EURO
MDTHDVSQVSKYAQHLQKQKQTLRNAQSRKGQHLKPTKSRDEIIMQFMFQRMMASNRPTDLCEIRSSFVPPAYPPSVAAMSTLQRIMINELALETHHRGYYILLRAVTPSDRMTAVMAVVEDERGDVLMLQLYNQEKDISTNGRLVEGTTILVKEPYLKIMADENYGIRVDHLSDIRFLPSHDPLVPSSWGGQHGMDTTANCCKTKGNNHFNKAEYYLAIDCYSKALDSSPTTNEALIIRLNRALTYLKTHQFDAALYDLETILSDQEPSEKALFRKSQALYHLARFEESCKVHQVLSATFPSNHTAKVEFNRATARLAEQQTAKYPFKYLQLEAKKRCPPLLDRATYIGPVSVRSTESRGRGLFTTEAVQAGDLLFCEKALAHAFHDDAANASSSVSILMNTETNTVTMGTQADLIALIAQKLYKNPSLMSMFTDLYHGSYHPIDIAEVDGTPVVDTFLIERIMSLNCFGCSLSSRESHIHTMKGAKSQLEPTENKKFHSCGVWPLASYINHSCYSNVHRSFIGDMMIVRATQNLPANTELFFWYTQPSDSTSNTKPPNLKHWGFQCNCVICQDSTETGEGDLMKRRRLTADLVHAFQALSKSRKPKSAISRIEELISKLEETYRKPAVQVPRLGISKAYLSLAVAHAAQGALEKTVEFALKTLESLGYVLEGGGVPHTPGAPLHVMKWGLMLDGLVGCWMILCRAYCDLAPDLASQAEGYARITYKMCVGEDETFEDTYSRFSKRADGLLDGVA